MNQVSEEKAHDLLVDVVTTVIQSLVDNEAEVEVEIIPEQLHTNLRVTTDARDVGKVLGRGGQTAEALRIIVAAMGSKLQLPYCTLFVEDPRKLDRNVRAWSAPKRRNY